MSEIQFKPAFGDDGRPVLTSLPEEIEIDLEADIRAGVAEFTAEFLRQFAALGDAEDIGRTVIILAFLAGLTEMKTKAELAAHLKISPGRLTQILQGLNDDFQSLANLKNRSISEIN